MAGFSECRDYRLYKQKKLLVNHPTYKKIKDRLLNLVYESPRQISKQREVAIKRNQHRLNNTSISTSNKILFKVPCVYVSFRLLILMMPYEHHF
jgi:hypothetical protein